MASLMQELLPYIKAYAGLYLIANVLSVVIAIVIIIHVFKLIMKPHK